MEEQLVSPEVAKLAKEVGYDQSFDIGVTCRLQNVVNKEYEKTRPILESDLENAWCIFNETYPTQSQLQKWLREIHNIEVWANPFVFVSRGSWKMPDETYACFVFRNGKWVLDRVDFLKFEDALEEGLKAALKILKAEL